MAHSGDGGALPCGWWSASGKCIEDCLVYHSAALTAVQADAVAAPLATVWMIERCPLDMSLVAC
jgi:hypothetical protein